MPHSPVRAVLRAPLRLPQSARRGTGLGPNIAGALQAGNWTVTGNDATHIATFSANTLRYQSDTTSPQLLVQAPGILTIGRLYEVIVVTSAFASGAVKSDAFATANRNLSSALGTVRFTDVAINANFTFTRNTTNVDLTVSSITIRQIQ